MLRVLLKNFSDVLNKRLVSLSIFLAIVLKGVEARRCLYTNEQGQPIEFYCNAYELCCATMCCRARSIGFFQLWYFWLLIMLMLLLCSGGGWWVRYRRYYATMGMPSYASENTNTRAARGFTAVSGLQPSTGQAPPPPYGPAYSTVNLPAATQFRPQQQQQQTTQGPVLHPPYPDQNFYEPAPPYMGPPPSYAVATAGKTS